MKIFDVILDSLSVAAPASLVRFLVLRKGSLFESAQVFVGGAIIGVIVGFITEHYKIEEGYRYALIAISSMFVKEILEKGTSLIPSLMGKLNKNEK